MKKEFDFEDIGKSTPYRTPEHFFEEMQDKIVGQIQQEKRHHRNLRITIIASAIAAAMIAAIVFLPFDNHKEVGSKPTSALTAINQEVADTTNVQSTSPIKNREIATVIKQPKAKTIKSEDKIQPTTTNNDDEWIEQLSDEDLTEMASLYDNDVLLI